MVTAHDVAALLIAEQHAAGNPIDKMQLQKLLYLVQGAHLELWGTAAFREPILAYAHGPVVRVVEDTYRPVTEGTEPLDQPLGGRPDRLPPEVVESVRLIVQHFGTWTAPNLESFTKRSGAPWHAARENVPPGAPSSEEIPIEAIARWFRQHGVNPQPVGTTDADRDLFDRAAAGDEAALSAFLS